MSKMQRISAHSGSDEARKGHDGLGDFARYGEEVNSGGW